MTNFASGSVVYPSAIVGDQLLCTVTSDGPTEIAAVKTDGNVLWHRIGDFHFSADSLGQIYFKNSASLASLNKNNALSWEYEFWRGPYSIRPVIAPGENQLFSLSYSDTQFESAVYLVKVSTAGEPIFYNRIGYVGSGDQNAHLVHGPLAITKGGRVYVVVDSVLNAFDSDGRLLWQYALYQLSFTAPAVDPTGIIYVQTRDFMIAVKPDGTTRWRTPIPPRPGSPSANLNSGPVVAGDLILASWVDQMFCFTRSGKFLWQKAYSNAEGQPRVASDGSIFIRANSSVLYCLDDQGNSKWQMSPVNGAPILGDDGTIYVGRGNSIHALDGTARGPHPWPMEGRTPARRNISAGLGFASSAMNASGFIARMSAEGVSNAALESSTNLQTWTVVTNLDVTFDRSYLDRDATNVSAKFFRLRSISQ